MPSDPFTTKLQTATRALAKASPAKAYTPMFDVFCVLAGAGRAPGAGHVVRAMMDSKIARAVVSWYAIPAIDAFCVAAGLGDLSGGTPVSPQLAAMTRLAPGVPLEARAAAWGVAIRKRLTTASEPPPPTWRTASGPDLWTAAQHLAAPRADGSPAPTEPEALEALSKYIAEWTPDAKVDAEGDELVLALDLAFRLGARDRIPAWLERMGMQFGRQPFVLQAALGLPEVSAAIAGGLLRNVIKISDAHEREALSAVARFGGASVAGPVAAPTNLRREVDAEYNQFHLEPDTLDAKEKKQVYFQDARETAQGMSIFPTKVGIGTPADTLSCVVDVIVEHAAPKKLELGKATRAVAFPLKVRGPLQLRGVASEDRDEPLNVPSGDYDVLARFSPAKKRRVYDVTLSFFPQGALKAPRCLRIEEGKPPARVFVAGK